MRKKTQKNFLSKDDAKRLENETLESSTEVINGEVEESVGVEPQPAETESTSYEEILKNFEIYSDMETVLRSSLLGYFEGKDYKIRKEVANDLLKLPKIIDEQTLGTIVCHSYYQEYMFKFLITYDNFSTYSSARIYLLEDMDKIGELKTLKTLIGESVRPGGSDILEFLIKEWNLKKAGGDGEEQTVVVSELDAVLLGIKTDYVFNQELIEILSQIYVIRISALLSECGQIGEKILAEYNKLLKDYAVKRPSVLQKYTLIKHVLDSIIKENGGFEIIRQEHEKELKEVLASFYEPLKKINVRYFEGVEIAYPSVARAKTTKEPVKSSSNKLGEKGEKPYYIKTADAAKVEPYKYGAVPKMPEAGKVGAPPEKKEMPKTDNVEDRKKGDKPAPKTETETKPKENEDNDLINDKDLAKILFEDTVNPLEKAANQLGNTGESLEEDNIKGKAPAVKPPEPYL